MRFLLVAMGLTAMNGVGFAAPSNNVAATRAVSYQSEVRQVLKQHHWRITHDSAGTLTARHVLGPDGGDLGGAYSEPAGYARLTIQFKPKSVADTETLASIVAVHVASTQADGKFVFAEPVPFNNPKATRSVEELLAEARRKLAGR